MPNRNHKLDEWLTENGLLSIEGWARDGFSYSQIAQNIGISESTFYKWKSENPEISEALKKGRRPVQVSIENAFYSKCEWNEVEEVREEVTVHPDGSTTKRKIKQRRWIPPDTGALIFALKNLKGDKWRDKPVFVDKDDSEEFEQLLKVVGGRSVKKD